MNGIKCRNCNKANPLGSKFCNNCGTPLPPQTTQICENCGTANPQNRLYCDNCGHRLVAATPRSSEEKPPSEVPATPPSRHGFILPSRRPGDTGELDPDDLPEWLKTGERPNAEPDPERQTRITDWLQELTELKKEEETEQPFTIDYGFLERPKWPGRVHEEQPESTPPEAELPPNLFDDILLRDEQAGSPPSDWVTETSEAPSRSEEHPDEDSGTTAPVRDAAADSFPESEWAEERLPSPGDSDVEPASSDEFADNWLSDWSDESSEPQTVDDTLDWMAELASHAPDEATLSDETWLTAVPSAELADAEPTLDEEPEAWGAEFTLDSSPADAMSENSGNEWLAKWDQEEGATSDYTPEVDWLPDLDEDASTAAESASFAEAPLAAWDDEEHKAAPSFAWDDADVAWDESEGAASPQPTDTSTEEETTPEALVWDEVLSQDETVVADWLHELDETPADESGTVSDWLTDFQTEEEVAAIPPEAEPDEQLTTEAPGLEPEELALEPESTLPDDFDLTNWLQELETQADVEDDVAAVTATHLVEDDLPEWLPDESLTRAVTPDHPLTPPISPELIEVPDWLTELRTSDTTFFAAPEEKTEAEATAAQADVSSWLDDLSAEEPSTSFPLASEPEPESTWGMGDVEELILPPSHEIDDVPTGLARAELPDWLQESLTEGNIVATSGNQPLGMPDLPDLPLPQDDLPEWLNTPTDGDFDSALEAALSVQGSEMVGGALGSEWTDILGDVPVSAEMIDLEQADIPEWIQELKPRALTGVAPEAEAEPEQLTGPLEGMRGVIPIEPIIAQPKTNVAAANPYTVTKEQQQQAALLHQLIHAEPKVITKVGLRPQAMPVAVRLTLSVLLLLAVLLGLFLPWFNINLPLVLPEPLPGITEAQNSLAAAAGSTALVAFEYTPGMAGELDPQAKLIINQLTASGKQVVAVSQFAAGLGQANALDVALIDSQFIPGESIGLRSLADCLSEEVACSFPFTPGDVGLIVVLTAERESLIGWIEQVGTQTEIPIVAGTTQGLAPVAQPYLNSGQLDGLIAGLPGAAAYEQAISGQQGDASLQWQAQTLAQLLVIGVFSAGALYYGLSGGRRNR